MRTELKVVRRRVAYHERDPRIGRVVELEREEQHLVEVSYRTICGFELAWRQRVVDREVIPDHVLVSLGAFGDTGGWRSKFAEHIR